MSPCVAKKRAATSLPKTSGKCAVCNVIWQSPEDIKFGEKHSQRKSAWVGCDKPGCKFWGHVLCVGLIVTPGKAIELHAFFCPKHRC